MKCTNCGNTNISQTANFCIICGKKLKKGCKCWVKNRTTMIAEKIVALDMDFFYKNQSPSDDFASSQPKSIANWRIASAVNLPHVRSAF